MGDGFSLPLDRDGNEWITTWLTSKEYMIASLTITSFQILIMPILFTLHIHRLIKNNHSRNLQKSNPLRIRYIIIDNVSLSSIVFSFLSALITIANYASVFNNSTCRAITIIQNIFWLFTKTSIYLVVLLRLQAAFWGSAYEINRNFKNVCYILITLFCVALTIGTCMPYPIGVDSEPLPHTNFCLLIIPPWCVYDCICQIYEYILYISMSIWIFPQFCTSKIYSRSGWF